jgi:hypothetical protein
MVGGLEGWPAVMVKSAEEYILVIVLYWLLVVLVAYS